MRERAFITPASSRFFSFAEQLFLDLLARKLGLGRSPGGWRRWRRRRRRRSLDLDLDNRCSLGLAGLAKDAAAFHFHNNSVLPPVAEALLHLASLDRPLDAKRCAHSQFRLFRIAHRLTQLPFNPRLRRAPVNLANAFRKVKRSNRAR